MVFENHKYSCTFKPAMNVNGSQNLADRFLPNRSLLGNKSSSPKNIPGTKTVSIKFGFEIYYITGWYTRASTTV